MYIKNLVIKNFRCFDSTGIKINFDDNPTAIIGRNGSGKTAILEALNYLIGQEYLPTKISETDFHCDANNINDEIVIECETNKPFFQTLDLVSQERFTVSKNVIIPCNKVRLTIKRRELTDKVIDDPYIIIKITLPILGDINESIYDDIKGDYKTIKIEKNNGFIVHYKLKNGDPRSSKVIDYQLTYNPNRIQKLGKSYYLDRYRDKEVSGGYSFINKILTDLHWKFRKEKSGSSEVEIKKQYDKLASSLRGIVDEKGILIRAVNEKIKEICSENKKLELNFINIEQPYKSAFLSKAEKTKCLFPENLGSGFNILIAYALFFYIAEQEKTPIVLVIDEPELHLHSDWQKKFYEVLTNQSSLQIIYSTQSENFISFKDWKQIKAIKDSSVYPKKEILDEAVTVSDEQTFTRAEYLDDYSRRNLHISCILKENLELFFSKKVVLVEGVSEKYALPKLLHLCQLNISNFSVSIIAVWGKTKIKIYQTICKCFGVDYFTVFDTDKKNNDEPDNENSLIENNTLSNKSFKYSSNFEALLGISGQNKFQNLVRKIDNLSNLEGINEEIKNSVKKLKEFVNEENN